MSDAPKEIWVWVDYDGTWDGVWLSNSEALQPERLPDARFVHGDLYDAVKAESERLRAENERLRAGIQAFLDGCPEIMPRATAYRNDGVPSKHDQCQHGQYMWEGCEACADIFMRWALDGWPDRAALKGETP